MTFTSSIFAVPAGEVEKYPARHSTTPDKNIKRDPNRSGPNRSDGIYIFLVSAGVCEAPFRIGHSRFFLKLPVPYSLLSYFSPLLRRLVQKAERPRPRPHRRYILELAWDPVMATADRGDDWWDKYWDDESMRICKTSR
ncbi:hypothetical protein BC938DRAFT_471267 [Jimgerdemannia flammicorona]|uniref:Uncharacterized protein n=1 Tax=Jimgerdemannia flammicorona TaxID=994334 RepID=A0A433Q8G1_9FUNG|nr:hypothetical protein BC938DRAFT_471267 [Jimgerdemannia flammicorona]